MKLTPSHLKFFRAECEKNLERLGLQGWKVFYQFKKLDDSFAQTQWHYSGRVATISLATDFPKPYDNLEQQIKETALHECLEILLSPFTDLAMARDFCRSDFDKEVHSVIRVLEKVL